MIHILQRITGARSGRTVLAGMSTAVSWTFAGLVLACVFVATAGARESLGFRTRALQQAIAAGPAIQNAVQADADWLQFDEAVSSREPSYGLTQPTAVPLTTDQITAATSELASALAATPLPLAGRSADWSGLGTAVNPVIGAAPAANIGSSPPQMEIMYRDALSRNSRLVSGHWPAASGASPASGASAPRAFQVVVTRATAQRFGLRPGSQLEVSGQGLISGITLVVTGIVQPAVPHSAFWTLDGIAAKPALNLRRSEPLWWVGAAFAGPGEVGDLQRTFSVQGMHLTWEFPLALGGVDADHAQELEDHLNRAVSESAPGTGGRAGVPLGTVVLSSGLVSTLADFLGTQAQVEAMLALLFTGLTVLGVVMLLLGARLLAESRSADLALMRARGASLSQLAALTLRGSVAIVLPAAAAGAAAAVASTPDAAAPLAWWLAGVTVLVAIAGPPLVVARRHRAVNLAADRAADPAARRRAQARRWVAEGAMMTAAAGGLILLHQHGAGGNDAYLSAAPVLVAAPAALVILRLYPLVLRGLLRLSGGRAGAAGFVGLATAARAPVTTALPAFALVLALAMAAFGGIAGSAILRGEVAASWQATGADVRIDLGFETAGSAAIQRALAATPGVRHSAAAVVTEASLPDGTDVTMAAVDPIQYARLTADTPLGNFPPGVLMRRPARAAQVPVLASPAAVAALRSSGSQLHLIASGGSLLHLITGSVLQAKVAGTISATPAMPGVPAFVILPRWALRGGPPANLIVATGDGLDEKKLTALVNGLAPAASISFRSDALAALTGAPLQHGTYMVFVAGIAAAGIFGAAVLLLSLALGARSRSLILALLSTVGLGRGQARLLVAAGAVPPILASVVGGAACAWALAPLTGPALDLSVFTGSAQPVTLHADWVALAVPATGAILLGLLVLTAHTVISAGRDLSSVLRWDG